MKYGDVGLVMDVGRGTSANCMVVRPAMPEDFPGPTVLGFTQGIYYVMLLDGELLDPRGGRLCKAGDGGPVHERNVTWEGRIEA